MDTDEISAEVMFVKWLGSCMHGKIGDHMISELSTYPQIPIISEAIQLSWLDNKDWENIRAYNGRWYKSASVRLIAEAPEDIVTRYVLYCAPLDEIKQVTLVQRDINNGTHLAREYFGCYHACKKAQKLIKNYDVKLWHRVLIVNYGWEWKFERKFGTLGIWQQKLKAHLSELTSCRFEDVESVLDTIQ